MADTVSTISVWETPQELVLKFLNLSDGTGESAVVKVDKSTYTNLNLVEPNHFNINRIEYNLSGMSVGIFVDATTDVKLAELGGTGGAVSGHMDFTKFGGLSTKATGDTGDIYFTTTGHTSGDSYDITLYLKKSS